MTTDQTTGTQTQEGGDAADSTQTAGTPADEGRNAESQGISISKEEALAWKGKAETLNSLMASYGVSSPEELRERLAQSPAAPAVERPEDDGDDDSFDPADVHRTAEFVEKGDAVARLALRMAKRIEKLEKRSDQLTRGIGDVFTARDIEDRTLRARTLAHYEKNKYRLGDINAALAEVQVADQRAEITKLKAELAKMNKPIDPDVRNAPSTGGREITATQVKRKMTLAQATAEAERLRGEGKPHAAMKFLEAAEIEG